MNQMTKKIIADCNAYCEFEEGKAYVLMIIPRKKENGENTEKDKLGLLQRKIVRNIEEVTEAMEYFETFMLKYPEICFRVYINVNRRCLTKALFSVQSKLQLMVKDLHFGNKEVFDRITKLSTTMKTSLCEKSARDTKYFHFDIDYSNKTQEGHELTQELLRQLKYITEVTWFNKTLNGYVAVTEPFNPQLLKEHYPDMNMKKLKLNEFVEIKPDSYLYLGVYNYQNANA